MQILRITANEDHEAIVEQISSLIHFFIRNIYPSENIPCGNLKTQASRNDNSGRIQASYVWPDTKTIIARWIGQLFLDILAQRMQRIGIPYVANHSNNYAQRLRITPMLNVIVDRFLRKILAAQRKNSSPSWVEITACEANCTLQFYLDPFNTAPDFQSLEFVVASILSKRRSTQGGTRVRIRAADKTPHTIYLPPGELIPIEPGMLIACDPRLGREFWTGKILRQVQLNLLLEEESTPTPRSKSR